MYKKIKHIVLLTTIMISLISAVHYNSGYTGYNIKVYKGLNETIEGLEIVLTHVPTNHLPDLVWEIWQFETIKYEHVKQCDNAVLCSVNPIYLKEMHSVTRRRKIFRCKISYMLTNETIHSSDSYIKFPKIALSKPSSVQFYYLAYPSTTHHGVIENAMVIRGNAIEDKIVNSLRWPNMKNYTLTMSWKDASNKTIQVCSGNNEIFDCNLEVNGMEEVWYEASVRNIRDESDIVVYIGDRIKINQP